VVIARLATTIRMVNEALQNYRFHEAAQGVYNFSGRFFDWYMSGEAELQSR